MEGSVKRSTRKSSGHYLGHEKEPPSKNNPRSYGRGPSFHSHSSRPKRAPKTGGRKR